MALPTPANVTQGVSLQTIDIRDAGLMTAAAGLGDTSQEVVFDPVDAPYLWLVERIVVFNTCGNATEAFVFEGDALAQNLRDSTQAGNSDVADYASPILIKTSQSLRIRWTGTLTAGAVGTAHIQYRIVQRTAGG